MYVIYKSDAQEAVIYRTSTAIVSGRKFTTTATEQPDSSSY